MKQHAFTLLIVTALTKDLYAQYTSFTVQCTREGIVCRDCTRLGMCVKNPHPVPGFQYDDSKEVKCPVGFVCDQLSLWCERRGTCRFKDSVCPSKMYHQEELYANPYSCNSFFVCDNREAMLEVCVAGKAYNPVLRNCDLDISDPSCADYPVLCETAGQTGFIGGSNFHYECLEEEGPPHVFYPVLKIM